MNLGRLLFSHLVIYLEPIIYQALMVNMPGLGTSILDPYNLVWETQ